MDSESSLADSMSSMNAPLPNFTSSTSEEIPSAAFLDTIDDVIRGIEATVPVTSLSE